MGGEADLVYSDLALVQTRSCPQRHFLLYFMAMQTQLGMPCYTDMYLRLAVVKLPRIIVDIAVYYNTATHSTTRADVQTHTFIVQCAIEICGHKVTSAGHGSI